MKRRKYILSIIFLSLFFSLIGCKHSVDKPSANKYQTIIVPGGKIVGISIDPKSFATKSRSVCLASRTIFPEAWTNTEKSNLDYKVKITDNASPANTIAENTYTWADLKNNTVSFVLGQGETYKFTITAYTKGATAKKVLKIKDDTITKTINSDTYISFLLIPCRDSSDSAKASIDIRVQYRNPKIYDASGNERLITSYEAKLLSSSGSSITLTASLSNNSKVGADYMETLRFERSNDIAPGLYTFILKLLDDSSPSKVVSSISDTVILDPAKKSSKIILCPVVIDGLNPPSNFKVIYKRPGDTDSKYKVSFEWIDKSSNEDGFIIEILKEDGSAFEPKKEYTISADTQSYETGADFDLITKYKAKIYAKKSNVRSSAVEYKNSTNGNIIHLARLKYDLNGGKFIPNPDNKLLGLAPASATAPVIAYYTCKNEAYEFKLAGDAKLPVVYKTAGGKDLKFLGWDNKATSGASNIENWHSIPKNEFGNYELKAVWESP